MLNRRIQGLAAVVVILFAAGCSSQKAERLNAPPQGTTERPNEVLQPHFTTMADNATKRDASLSDAHFEPHAKELSGLGVWRITRIGDQLNSTGGIIRYETSLGDEDMVAARLQSVRDFLAASGYDTDLITVESGLSRNVGGTAQSAIEARARAQQAASESGGGDAGASMGGASGPQ